MAKPQPPAGAEATESWPLVVWAARLSVYFLAQGALVLLAYAYYGFGTDPDSFALGFRIDPILAAFNLAWGLVGTYIGFFRPRHATCFVLAFADAKQKSAPACGAALARSATILSAKDA